jgi:TatD DNase family protein
MDVFDQDRNNVMERAREAGVEQIITIGSDRDSSRAGLRIAQNFPEVYATVGIHPHDAKTFNNEILSELKESLKQQKVVAVGEIGLDYHYMHSPKDVQMDVFKKQIAAAIEADLPIIVHSREAQNDTMKTLKEDALNTPGVLHCFSGNKAMARSAIDLGFLISIAGPVTFRNADNLREIARFIPDDHLLIETDSPYLSPAPKRGRRNEPAFLLHTARAVSEVRGVALSDIARITTLNARRLFRIGEIPAHGEIAYKIRDSLYLNITNRCTNRCGFCVKFHTSFVKGHNLRLEREPSPEEIVNVIGDPKRHGEIVFCGIGEPLLRLDTVKQVSRWIKQHGGKVRINTNGHGNLINRRNILPELQGIVDSISVSLYADEESTYEDICKPSFQHAFQSVLSFIGEAKKYIPEIDLKKCKEIAQELGVELRVREFNVVG